MNFGLALVQIKGGECVRRAGWNGKNMWIKLQKPDENSKMSLPYIYMSTVQGNLVPWLASQTDMLSDDWENVVNIPKTAHEQRFEAEAEAEAAGRAAE